MENNFGKVSESQRRALKKYRETHREKVNEISKKSYENNEEYRIRKQQKMREYMSNRKCFESEYKRLSSIAVG